MGEEGRVSPSLRRDRGPSHLVIGRILAAHGLKGEVEAQILTDFPQRFEASKTIYLGEELRPAVIERHRFHRDRVILKLGVCRDRDEADAQRGKLIYVPLEEAAPLQEDEYYLYQVLGLDVWTSEGEFLGRVSDILFTGSNDVYVVRDGHQEVLIPAISDVVREVDVDNGRLTVLLPEGLR